MLREGRLKVGMSLWQWRDLESGERIGLHVLLSCSDRVSVVEGRRRSRAAIDVVCEDGSNDAAEASSDDDATVPNLEDLIIDF